MNNYAVRLTVTAGERVTLPCPHRERGANVTWYRLGCRGRACAPTHAWGAVGGDGGGGAEATADGTALVLREAARNQTGLYYCRVRAGTAEGVSCGTFLRVRDAVPAPFLALSDGAKNRLMAAEGALLLLCAAGPGMLLLLRKRWANERLLQGKKSLGEEENLYEGLVWLYKCTSVNGLIPEYTSLHFIILHSPVTTLACDRWEFQE